MRLARALRLEMRLNLEIAAASALVIGWTLLPHGLWHHVGFTAFAWPILGHWLRLRRLGREHAVDARRPPRPESVRDTVRTLALAVPLLVYVEWARRVGVAPLVTLGTVLFFLGTLISFANVWTRAGRPFVGWGLALACAGLSVPNAMPSSAVSADAMIGAAGIFGGLWAALTYALRLARLRREAAHVGPTPVEGGPRELAAD